jgi:hypothetical protein
VAVASREDQSVSAIVTALSEQADHEDDEIDLEEVPLTSSKTKDKDNYQNLTKALAKVNLPRPKSENCFLSLETLDHRQPITTTHLTTPATPIPGTSSKMTPILHSSPPSTAQLSSPPAPRLRTTPPEVAPRRTSRDDKIIDVEIINVPPPILSHPLATSSASATTPKTKDELPPKYNEIVAKSSMSPGKGQLRRTSTEEGPGPSHQYMPPKTATLPQISPSVSLTPPAPAPAKTSTPTKSNILPPKK